MSAIFYTEKVLCLINSRSLRQCHSLTKTFLPNVSILIFLSVYDISTVVRILFFLLVASKCITLTEFTTAAVGIRLKQFGVDKTLWLLHLAPAFTQKQARLRHTIQYHGVGIKLLLIFLKALEENQHADH